MMTPEAITLPYSPYCSRFQNLCPYLPLLMLKSIPSVPQMIKKFSVRYQRGYAKREKVNILLKKGCQNFMFLILGILKIIM